MRKLFLAMLAALAAALIASCGGGSDVPALVDGSHPLKAGTDRSMLGAQAAPKGALAQAPVVTPDNLMDWAEGTFPQYFPSHRVTQFAAPYLFRYYPETNVYIGIDGQFVRLLGVDVFGPQVITVGVLSDFTCLVFPQSCGQPNPGPTPQPPTAIAGEPQAVYAGMVVNLLGSGSDPNSLSLTYTWTLVSRPAGSQATIGNAASASAFFQTDLAGTYVAQLVVNNGTLSSDPSTVSITAYPYFSGYD